MRCVCSGAAASGFFAVMFVFALLLCSLLRLLLLESVCDFSLAIERAKTNGKVSAYIRTRTQAKLYIQRYRNKENTYITENMHGHASQS